MQNSGKGWTRVQNIDSYEEISFMGKYAVFIKNGNEFLKKSDFWYTWSNDHLEQVFQISERSDQYSWRYVMLKYQHIGIALFCIETIQFKAIVHFRVHRTRPSKTLILHARLRTSHTLPLFFIMMS